MDRRQGAMAASAAFPAKSLESIMTELVGLVQKIQDIPQTIAEGDERSSSSAIRDTEPVAAANHDNAPGD